MNQGNKAKRENGEGTLYFDQQCNTYRCQVTYCDPEGTTKRKSFTGKTPSIVRERKNKFLQQLTLNNVVNSNKCTIVDLLSECAEYDLKIGDITESAYVRRLDVIKIFQNYQIGDRPIIELTERMINAFLIELKHRYSNSVIGKCYSAISKAYNIAISKRILTYNLMNSPFIKKPKSDIPDRNIRAFTLQEERRFLSYLKHYTPVNTNFDNRFILIICLFSGMRAGEVCALKYEDIDLKNNLIHVRRTMTRGLDYQNKLGCVTKTSCGRRDIPIDQKHLRPFLEQILKNYSGNPYGLLFYNKAKDSFCSANSVNHAFKRICESANIQVEGGVHILRHTFATRCIEAGVRAETLKGWLGHKDVSTTINTYVTVFQRLQDQQMEQVESYNQRELLCVG